MILARKRIKLEEATEEYTNPGRGWYKIYTFSLEKRDFEELKWLPFSEQETLALVIINIGAFRQKVLDSGALYFAGQILERFREAGKEIILRIVYDNEGKGLEREPADIRLVEEHMRQMGTVVAEYAANILLSQGIFVGNWGEMHGSKFLSPERLRKLTYVWHEATQGKILLAFRKPMQCRAVESEQVQHREIGFFDDAIFGSANHMGTFGEKKRTEAVWEEVWCMEDELIYMEQAAKTVPCGGEAVAGENLSPEETIAVLRHMHISYLNCVYDERILEQWKKQTYANSCNLYQYIGEHLGYRLFVSEVSIPRRGTGKMTLTIVNTGFANLTQESELSLLIKAADGGSECRKLDYDIRTLAADEKKELVILLDHRARGDFFLQLRRKKDKKTIRFANAGMNDLLFLGRVV